MWNTSNKTGDWSVDLDVLFFYLFTLAPTLVPVLAALLCLRRWLSLLVGLAALLALATRNAAFFESTSSSTAVFAYFIAPVYGVPVVLGLVFLEWAWSYVRRRQPDR